MQERRAALHGPVPKRAGDARRRSRAEFGDTFEEFHKGTESRKASTTMVFVRMLSKLLRDEKIGKFVVPIVPDEARTFGMEALFRQVGIYAHAGQLYEPVDRDTLLYYKEAEDGQILEEGINEAGSMSSFIAAGTAYATHGINMIPFFIFYSMFGFQRVGDLIWAGADMRMKGFVVGGTAGRTTLNGEGLQHEDGQSHVLALPVPNCQSYDPAFAYELAVIIEDGIKRMYRGPGRHLLLPDRDERAVRASADAGGRARGHPQGDVRLQADQQAEGEAARAAVRQRHHPAAGARGAEDPRGEVRRRRRRVERHQLRQPASRRPRVRALESPASRPRSRACRT